MAAPAPLTREAALPLLRHWLEAWARHDLEGVLALLDEDLEFQHWTGATVRGKAGLRRA